MNNQVLVDRWSVDTYDGRKWHVYGVYKTEKEAVEVRDFLKSQGNDARATGPHKIWVEE